MSQQTYSTSNRSVNRYGDFLPGQKTTRPGTSLDMSSMRSDDNFRPMTSQGFPEYQKTRYIDGGSDDLFLNLANDTTVTEGSGRVEALRVGFASLKHSR
jgi:hypothetical protein